MSRKRTTPEQGEEHVAQELARERWGMAPSEMHAALERAWTDIGAVSTALRKASPDGADGCRLAMRELTGALLILSRAVDALEGRDRISRRSGSAAGRSGRKR